MARAASPVACLAASLFANCARASIALPAVEPTLIASAIQVIECEAALAFFAGIFLHELAMEFELQELHIYLAMEELLHVVGHQLEDLLFCLEAKPVGLVDGLLDVQNSFFQSGDSSIDLLLDFIVMEIVDPLAHDDQFDFLVSQSIVIQVKEIYFVDAIGLGI